VTAIQKFLSQHGDRRSDAVETYGPVLTERVKESEGDELLGALPLLVDWYPDRQEAWADLAAMGFDSGGKTTGVTTSEDQQAVLGIGLEGSAWEVAALTALTSRFPAVRTRALDALVDQWGFDPEKRETDPWDAAVLRAAKRYPYLPRECLSLIEGTLEGGVDPHLDMPWALLTATVEILASRPPKECALPLTRILDEKGKLVQALSGHLCPPELRQELQTLLTSGHVTAANLKVVEQVLRAAGASDLGDSVGQLLAAPDEESEVPGAPYLQGGVVVMTRATLLRQQEELRALERELRIEIPQAIKKARELGDLAENAEYHAARERQGIINSQFMALRELLAHVQCVEDIALPEGVAGVGTEVVLKDLATGDESTVWLLGIGDGHLGSEVISYDAPLGKALLGKKVGETVELDHGSEERKLQVVSITPRLPG
jgi:transcription elongation factor GreA